MKRHEGRSFDAAYYAELEARVTRVIGSVEGSLRPDQLAQLLELAEHNEPGAAIEMLVEMLVGRVAPVSRPVFDELLSLAEAMQLAFDVSGRLHPLVLNSVPVSTPQDPVSGSQGIEEDVERSERRSKGPLSLAPYHEITFEALRARGVPERVEAAGGAVVLERLARAAGSTRWYVLERPDQLPLLVESLRPGSCVSFYFDGRLRVSTYDDTISAPLRDILDRDPDAVFGRLREGSIEAEVDFVADERELEEYARQLDDGAVVLFGRFPGRDDDGTNAITLDLPDRDGVVRGHPH